MYSPFLYPRRFQNFLVWIHFFAKRIKIPRAESCDVMWRGLCLQKSWPYYGYMTIDQRAKSIPKILGSKWPLKCSLDDPKRRSVIFSTGGLLGGFLIQRLSFRPSKWWMMNTSLKSNGLLYFWPIPQNFGLKTMLWVLSWKINSQRTIYISKRGLWWVISPLKMYTASILSSVRVLTFVNHRKFWAQNKIKRVYLIP